MRAADSSDTQSAPAKGRGALLCVLCCKGEGEMGDMVSLLGTVLSYPKIKAES